MVTMKLNEITETGYYTCELDTERETIFEVIKNTDEVWLKETPEQTLLIDEWTYEYTDEDGRKHYEIYGGNLVSVVNAEPFDVAKITDTKYTMDVSDPTIASKCNGTSMMEDKPTRLEIAEQQLNKLKEKNEKLEQTLAEIEPILELYANSKIGEEQLDGTYKVIVECLSVPNGAYTVHYDPKPAKQALQKIRKV